MQYSGGYISKIEKYIDFNLIYSKIQKKIELRV